jgi:hypothetical protein
MVRVLRHWAMLVCAGGVPCVSGIPRVENMVDTYQDPPIPGARYRHYTGAVATVRDFPVYADDVMGLTLCDGYVVRFLSLREFQKPAPHGVPRYTAA